MPPMRLPLHTFLLDRWSGRSTRAHLLWRDMVGVGTLVNLLFSFAGLMLIAQGGPGAWAWALHFAPLPYNLFLLLAVGRSPWQRPTDMTLAAAWFVAMLVL